MFGPPGGVCGSKHLLTPHKVFGRLGYMLLAISHYAVACKHVSCGKLAASKNSVSLASGRMPTDVMNTMHEKLKGIIHIHQHDGSSHMWNATTMLHDLKFLTVQLRCRRMQLGLSVAESRALIIADRKQWEG